MPEYLAPGVYIEETSFRAKTIEGVSTTTTGFVGPTRYGPVDLEPDLVTSLVEFERVYGDMEKLEFEGSQIDNFMWHAVRAFFEEGGKRLYVSRIFKRKIGEENDKWSGYAQGVLAGSSPPMSVHARFPGKYGDARVTFTLKAGQNVLAEENGKKVLRSVLDRDVVLVRQIDRSQSPATSIQDYYLARRDAPDGDWRFEGDNPPSFGALDEDDEVRIITVSVTVQPLAPRTSTFVALDLPLDPQHKRAGSPDSLFDYFAERPASLSRARTVPIVLGKPDSTVDGLTVLHDFFTADALAIPPAASPPLAIDLQTFTATGQLGSTDEQRSVTVLVEGGDDGERPGAKEYEGEVDAVTDAKTGLKQFEDIEDISIVAAPGSTFNYEKGYRSEAQTIVSHLLNHAQRMRYRIAVIDSGDEQSIAQVRAMRARYDSTYGALYYPWVRVLDPLTQQEIHLPPSGFVAGIYARNDINRAVYKAPANEVVNLAIGFEQFLNKSQQDALLLGKILWSTQGSEHEGVELLCAAAEAGDAEALYLLGLACFWGQGVEKAFEAARELQRAAAMRGLPDAQFELSLLLELGIGGEVDAEGARRWEAKAAAAGHPRACLNRGARLANKKRPNWTKVTHWYARAAAAGNAEAADRLRRMTEESEEEERVEAGFAKDARQGDARESAPLISACKPDVEASAPGVMANSRNDRDTDSFDTKDRPPAIVSRFSTALTGKLDAGGPSDPRRAHRVNDASGVQTAASVRLVQRRAVALLAINRSGMQSGQDAPFDEVPT